MSYDASQRITRKHVLDYLAGRMSSIKDNGSSIARGRARFDSLSQTSLSTWDPESGSSSLSSPDATKVWNSLHVFMHRFCGTFFRSRSLGFPAIEIPEPMKDPKVQLRLFSTSSTLVITLCQNGTFSVKEYIDAESRIEETEG